MMRADLAQPIFLLESVEPVELDRPSDAVEDGRLMEDWIVSTLDAKETATKTEDWRESINLMTLSRRGEPAKVETRSKAGKAKPHGWTRFRLSYRHGITIVVLTDQALLKEEDLIELQGDVSALIEAGHHRLVLNFAAVERLSSWTAGAVAEALRQCTLARGGALRVCGLRPAIVAVFAVTGLGREVAIYQDEATAINAPWPTSPELRPLPLDVLVGLMRSANTSLPCEPDSAATPFDEDLPAMTGVRLISDHGPSRGKSVVVEGPRFIIGRDATCNLRVSSSAISRFHAAIESRAGRVFLSDLGSTNGTVVNGRTLRSEEVEVENGDRLQVGSLRFTIKVGSRTDAQAKVDDLVAGWLGTRDQTPIPEVADVTSTDDFPIMDGVFQPKHEVIEGVLVITPMTPDLDAEASIDPLRAKLTTLLDSSMPRRVVINLSGVGHLSGRAIGVIIAHHLKLDRVGGALRICEANPRVAAVLDQVRLNMLVEYHPTMDDAVLTPWARDASAMV